jgi:hypothetical protein
MAHLTNKKVTMAIGQLSIIWTYHFVANALDLSGCKSIGTEYRTFVMLVRLEKLGARCAIRPYFIAEESISGNGLFILHAAPFLFEAAD